MRWVLLLLTLSAPAPVLADALLAERTIRPREVIAATDLRAGEIRIPGAVTDPIMAIGQEAVTTIYAGQPVLAAYIAPPAAVERNELVELVFQRGGLFIRAEGRALGRGAVGDRLRVMNISSRTSLTGVVSGPGQVTVE